MKKLAMGLGASLVVVGFAAMHLRQELHAQREENAAGMVRVAALESAYSTGSIAARPATDGIQTGALIPATAAHAEPVPAAPAGHDQSAARNVDPLRAQLEQLQNNPQFLDMQRMMMRQMLEEEFPDLAKEFHLSKEKAGKLLDLLAKQRMDLAADSMSQMRGGDQDRAAREERERNRVQKEKAFEAELKALLGDDYAKWDKYEGAASQRQRDEYVRMEREELRHALNADGAPLTGPQFEQLHAAITAEQGRIDRESGGLSLKQHMQRLPEFNRRLVDVAASHLNPQQLDRYRNYLQEQQEMMSDMDAMGAFPGN